uniref:Putative secreted protein n=1 Tax=Anopheles marajoara TaxID=58244 RepID=A0A2M4C8A3_9DIPT
MHFRCFVLVLIAARIPPPFDSWRDDGDSCVNKKKGLLEDLLFAPCTRSNHYAHLATQLNTPTGRLDLQRHSISPGGGRPRQLTHFVVALFLHSHPHNHHTRQTNG